MSATDPKRTMCRAPLQFCRAAHRRGGFICTGPVFEPAAIETARRRFRLSTPAELPSRAALPQAPLPSRWSAARRIIPRPLPSRPPQPCRRDGLCQTSSRHHVGVRLSDRISNAVDDKIDVGVRVGFMRDSRFVARKAADMRLTIVAAPRLTKKVGTPDGVDELAGSPVTAAIDIITGRPWSWHFSAGRQWTPVSPAFIADNADMEMGAALAGIAFAQLADYMAAPISPVENWCGFCRRKSPRLGLVCLSASARPVPARVRVVFDELQTAIGSLPALP